MNPVTRRQLIAAFLLPVLVNATEFRVADFGAVPNDGKDDSAAIQRALDAAVAAGGGKVAFAAGTYDFAGLPGWERTTEPQPWTSYLRVSSATGLEIAGAVDATGAPATHWVKHNDLRWGQPAVLRVNGGTNVTLRNVTVDMTPYYYSAGKVLAVKGDAVTIEVLPGHPRVDGQLAHILGTYDFATRRAKEVRVTWDGTSGGEGLPVWRVAGNDSDRRMTLKFSRLAQRTKPGEGVFWFQGGYAGPLVEMANIHGLLVENVRIFGGHGFTLTCFQCRDITYRDVWLRPPAGRIATSCRDGFKLHRPAGNVLMERVHIEGCLGDDGQNIHGTWLSTVERRDGWTLVVESGTERPPAVPSNGSAVVLLNAEFAPVWRSTVTGTSREQSNLVVRVADELPAAVSKGWALEPQEWLPDSIHLKDCTYRSTGRFGVVLKASNALIEGCRFENNMAGMDIGGEWTWRKWLESGNPRRVEIRNCRFVANRLGMIGPKAVHRVDVGLRFNTTAGTMREFRIHDNVFEDEVTGIELRRCAEVWLWNNQFVRCGKNMRTDPNTTTGIHEQPPAPKENQ